MVDTHYYSVETAPPDGSTASNCMSYPKPTPRKVGRLLLDLLKHLEGDDGALITELVHVLVQSRILTEVSLLDQEPDLDTLVKMPSDMTAEPHVTFPRILSLVWLTVTDPATLKKSGWCYIKKVTKYLNKSKPSEIARHMKQLDTLLAGIRFIIEDFIHEVSPLNLLTEPPSTPRVKSTGPPSSPRVNRTTRSTTKAPTKAKFRTFMVPVSSSVIYEKTSMLPVMSQAKTNSAESSERAESAKYAESTESAKYAESTESVKKVRSAESVKKVRSAESAENERSAESVKKVRSAESAENARSAKSAEILDVTFNGSSTTDICIKSLVLCGIVQLLLL